MNEELLFLKQICIIDERQEYFHLYFKFFLQDKIDSDKFFDVVDGLSKDNQDSLKQLVFGSLLKRNIDFFNNDLDLIVPSKIICKNIQEYEYIDSNQLNSTMRDLVKVICDLYSEEKCLKILDFLSSRSPIFKMKELMNQYVTSNVPRLANLYLAIKKSEDVIKLTDINSEDLDSYRDLLYGVYLNKFSIKNIMNIDSETNVFKEICLSYKNDKEYQERVNTLTVMIEKSFTKEGFNKKVRDRELVFDVLVFFSIINMLLILNKQRWIKKDINKFIMNTLEKNNLLNGGKHFITVIENDKSLDVKINVLPLMIISCKNSIDFEGKNLIDLFAVDIPRNKKQKFIYSSVVNNITDSIVNLLTNNLNVKMTDDDELINKIKVSTNFKIENITKGEKLVIKDWLNVVRKNIFDKTSQDVANEIEILLQNNLCCYEKNLMKSELKLTDKTKDNIYNQKRVKKF